MCVGGGGGVGGYATSQTTYLYLKILNKTEPHFRFFCVFFISNGNFLDF